MQSNTKVQNHQEMQPKIDFFFIGKTEVLQCVDQVCEGFETLSREFQNGICVDLLYIVLPPVPPSPSPRSGLPFQLCSELPFWLREANFGNSPVKTGNLEWGVLIVKLLWAPEKPVEKSWWNLRQNSCCVVSRIGLPLCMEMEEFEWTTVQKQSLQNSTPLCDFKWLHLFLQEHKTSPVL